MRRIASRCSVALLSLLGVARAGQSKLVRVSDGRAPMGTYMAITVYASSQAEGRRAIAAAFARVEEVEAATSTYREQSDVSKLNRAAGGPAMLVSRHLWTVLRRAAQISPETNGAFDVTVGPLVALWKRTWKRGRAPSEAELTAARALVSYRAVRVAPNAPRVQLLRQGMSLELGGIAKGYAVDQAVVVLRHCGIRAALVDAGGDIRALGAPAGREAWLIGIRDPSRPGKILRRALLARDCAVATSGDYEQYGTRGGRRYSHILDPRTGRPVEGMASVTVVAPDAMTADAYATSASVLGPKAALAFAEERPGVEVMILCRREGKLATVRSSGFGRLEVDRPAKR